MICHSKPVIVVTDPFPHLFFLSCQLVIGLIELLISAFCCYLQVLDNIAQDHALITTLTKVYSFLFIPNHKVHGL